MSERDYLTRRTFLTRFGKTGLAVAVLGWSGAACSASSSGSPDPLPSSAGAGSALGVTTTVVGAPTSAGTTEPLTAVGDPEVRAADWARVDLGFVSAYLMIRAGEVAVIDTGGSGSVSSIEQVLADLGLGWSAVGHVILTHSHGDHVGSLAEVMTSADSAAAYAGGEDIPNINSPRQLTAVGDGDQVFGMDIVATPGHTPGHISVVDPIGRLLVAGDALNGAEGSVIGPNPSFTPDMITANQSVQKLATFDVDTLVFGHGEPVLSEGGAQLKALAAGL